MDPLIVRTLLHAPHINLNDIYTHTIVYMCTHTRAHTYTHTQMISCVYTHILWWHHTSKVLSGLYLCIYTCTHMYAGVYLSHTLNLNTHTHTQCVLLQLSTNSSGSIIIEEHNILSVQLCMITILAGFVKAEILIHRNSHQSLGLYNKSIW